MLWQGRCLGLAQADDRGNEGRALVSPAGHSPRRTDPKMRSRIIERIQQSVTSPLDRLAFALRTPPPGDALLETTGWRTGRPRVTPVCDCLEDETFWIVAQRGHGANFVRNIEADPRVRVKGSLLSADWRAGTAHILDDDDPEKRVRILARGNRWRRLCLQASASIGSDPLTVRIDLDPL